MTRRLGRYRYVVANLVPSPEAAGEVRLWVALPMDRPGQRISSLRLDPPPREVVEEEDGGNRVAVWRERPAPGTDRLAFTADFEVEVEPVLSGVDPERVARCDPSGPEALRFIRAEPWVERTPEILALASEVAGDETNPWRVVRRLFDRVRADLTYVYPEPTDRGAARALARRSGDCGEFAHLFVALARARGIPARAVTACWFEGSGHQWAEAFVPPYGWVPVDPSFAHALATDAPAFGGAEGIARLVAQSGLPTRDPAWLCGNLYPNRLVVFVGTNVEVRPRERDLARTFAFLQPGGGNALPPAVEVEGLGAHPVHGGFFRFDAAAREESACRREEAKTLAVSWFNAGDLGRAEAGLRLALEDQPANAFAWFHLGQVHQRRGEWAAAREAFGQALAGRGGSLKHLVEAWARVFLGMCFDAEGRRDEAVSAYEAAIATGIDYQGSQALARQFLGTPFLP